MRRTSMDWWNTRSYTGHSAMEMYVIGRILDGEWKGNGVKHPIGWSAFSAWLDTKLYLNTIGPWRMK